MVAATEIVSRLFGTAGTITYLSPNEARMTPDPQYSANRYPLTSVRRLDECTYGAMAIGPDRTVIHMIDFRKLYGNYEAHRYEMFFPGKSYAECWDAADGKGCRAGGGLVVPVSYGQPQIAADIAYIKEHGCTEPYDTNPNPNE